EHYSRENPVAILRDELSEKLVSMLEQLHEQLGQRMPHLRAEIKQALNDETLSAEARKQLRDLQAQAKKFDEEIRSPEELVERAPEWQRLAGKESAIVAAQTFYAFYQERRTLKKSDAIDLIHALYL